ncbi:MAG: DUF2213 domain-containing protein [Beijerinckiaceae bacterium]
MMIRDHLIFDATDLAVTRDGYVSGMAKVSRAGNVQQYKGYELQLTGEDANKTFGVYRDPEVVFNEDSMLSLVGRPVTRGHPPYGVDATTWKDLVVGNMGGKVVRDGEHVVAPMAIMDATAAKEVMDGARCLSAGYTVGLTKCDGVSADGTPYQFKQSGELRFNHVAYLPDNNPRAGNTRIGDNADNWGASPVTVSDKGGLMAELRKIMVDGLQVETTDAGATAIEKLTKTISDMGAKVKAAEEEEEKAKAKMDAAIAAKDALDAAKLTPVQIDAMVSARVDLVGKAKAIVADFDASGKTDADIRKAVVVAKLGDAAIAGKTDAYIDARFDILADEASKSDPVKDAKLETKAKGDLASIYTARDAALQNAWKGEAK